MKKIFFILLSFVLFSPLSGCGPAPEMAAVGKPAPGFTLVDRQGKTWILSELKGQVVFVNFWATWCPPCREEMPSMERLYRKMPKGKFKMLAILNKDDPGLADSFARQFGLTMPILNDQANAVGSQYGLTGVPETYIIDKEGIMREKFLGPAQWDAPGYVQMLMKYINQ